MRYAWTVVALLWVVALLNYLDRQVIFSVLPLLQSDLQLSNVQLWLLSTAFLWIYGVLSPFSGYMADRFGCRRVILIGLLSWSAITWATAYAHNFPEFVTARALMGISEASYLPAGLALIACVHGERTRSLATGLQFSGLYVGIIIGGFGGGWMGEHYGWRFAFLILGVAGVIYFVFLRSVLRDPASATRSRPQRQISFASAMLELFRLPGFSPLLFVFTGMATANWLVYTWLPLFLYERFHISLAQAGFMATFYNQAGCMAGMLLGGLLADSWSQRNPRARVLTQSCALAVAAPALALVGFTGSSWVVICSMVLFGVARAMYDCNAMPSLCQISQPELRSTGYGIFNGAGSIAGGVMAAAAGWMKSSMGLTAAFYIAGAILLVSALTLLLPAADAVAPETAA
jgi:MFS family permease